MHNLSVIVLCVTLLTACSETKEEKQPIDKRISNKEVSSSKQNVASKTEKNLEKPLPIGSETSKEKVLKQQEFINKNKNKALNQSRSIAINGQKFSTTDWPVVKGTTVYNLLMREPGKVKGTFVVVLTQGKDLSVSIKESYTVANLAKDTFRLVPKKRKVLDMMQEYKHLMQESFDVVELEVDYSPITEYEKF